VLVERIERLAERPEWLTRAIRLRDTGETVGHCGFHGPPDVIGRAEIGCTVFPEFRGQGYAKEVARALATFAFDQGVEEVYATVSPDNAPSLAVVRALGFVQVGTQEDEVDGLELVFTLQRQQ
jgi:RimJ/RimL family protein N-acetyltransferase